jgi:hypothetical protein
MRRVGLWLRGLAALVCLGAAWGAVGAAGAPGSCESEAGWTPSDNTHRFLVLAASKGVFFDRSGPSMVVLMKTGAAAEEVEMGALGIHADASGRAVFGPVPWQDYDAFLREPEKGSQEVMLRLRLSEPQYERVLDILHGWNRRVREKALLYPNDFHMNNILLVKQVTEALNRCGGKVKLYQLDWGLEDRISDDNPRSMVAFLVFQELRRLNASLHVPDGALPEGLLALAGSEPLKAREPAPKAVPVNAAARPAASGHEHHGHAPGHAHESGHETAHGPERVE